jgi:sugar-specific transcriptional regulator TrmB
MSSDAIIPILEQLGFTRLQAKIYLSCLELGAQPASVIAKKAGLKRGHTYNLLSQMKDGGYIQEFIKDGVRNFISCSPTTLLSILSNRAQEIEVRKEKLMQAMPILNAIRNPLIIQPKVRFYQGIDGIKEVYDDTIREDVGTIYAICDWDYLFPPSKSKELHDWMWNYAERRSKKRIIFRAIANKSTESDVAFRRGQKRKIKMLRGVYLPVEMMVYGSKVAFMSSKEDMVGVIIEDAAIADTLRNLHKAIWPFLPDYK